MRCPALHIEEWEREVWQVFRLMHHRSPDQPGQSWQRISTYADLQALPARYMQAFSVIDLETYYLAADVKKSAQSVGDNVTEDVFRE